MNPIWISVIVFVCVFGGALLGSLLGRTLPAHHLSLESKKMVNVAVGLIATLSALVLGLLVGSVHSSFDAKGDAVKRIASQLIVLDRVIKQYGPGAEAARVSLQKGVGGRFVTLLTKPDTQGKLSHVEHVSTEMDLVQVELLKLVPSNPSQDWNRNRALQIAGDMEQTRWLLVESFDSSVPTAFLVILVLWLTVIFVNFGLFAPKNATVFGALFLCALSVACAILLILEMDGAFDGPIQVSMAPLNDAIAHIIK
jgi:hypothetical protein